MPPIPATIGRARLQQTREGLRIVIPAFWQFRFFSRVVVTPILLAFLLWHAWQAFPDDTVFMIALTVYGVGILGIKLSWRALGREIVTVSKTDLTLRIEIAGMGWTRLYALAQISGLCLGEARAISRRGTYYWFLVFNYDGEVLRSETILSIVAALNFYSYDPRRRRFAAGLSESEAQALIRIIEDCAGVPLTTRRSSALPA